MNALLAALTAIAIGAAAGWMAIDAAADGPCDCTTDTDCEYRCGGQY